jgi:cytochrome c oxidase subunit 3
MVAGRNHRGLDERHLTRRQRQRLCRHPDDSRRKCDKAARWLAVAAVGGLLFGIAQWERWSDMIHRGAGLDHNPWGTPLFGASFFTLTGFHLIHVVVGIFYMTGLALRAARRRVRAEDVETGALYWQFVVVMWLVIFVTFVLP